MSIAIQRATVSSVKRAAVSAAIQRCAAVASAAINLMDRSARYLAHQASSGRQERTTSAANAKLGVRLVKMMAVALPVKKQAMWLLIATMSIQLFAVNRLDTQVPQVVRSARYGAKLVLLATPVHA